MLIRQTKTSAARPHQITPEGAYLARRRFLRTAFAAGIAGLAPISGQAAVLPAAGALVGVKSGYRKLAKDDIVTPEASATTYNNFYEFAIGKDKPAKMAASFKPRPWQIAVGGLCAKPGTLDLDAFLKPHDLEERVYRHRCVEGWSMVIPWDGISLAEVVKRFEPLGSAKYVVFESVHRPSELPGQNEDMLIWPYVEALRLDEALNPLAMLAVGAYGKTMPIQNGAPIRLIAPWKYGFKGIKSIVKITFAETAPPTTWAIKRPTEYAFYANVNPNVDHPRHTQANERRISGGGLASLLEARRPTLMFNGYEEEVGHLYAGLDLAKNF